MFTPTFTLVDDQQTINADGSAHLNDFVNYANTVVGLNSTAPISSVVLLNGVITVTLKDARSFVVTCHTDGSYNVGCTGFFTDSEFQTLRAVSQVISSLMVNNSVANLTNSFV